MTTLLRRLVRNQRGHLLKALLGALLVMVAMLGVPLVTARVVDALSRPDPLAELPVLAAVLALLGVLRTVGGALRKWYAGLFMNGMGRDLRVELHDHLQGLDVGYHARMGSGQLLGRSASDLAVVEAFVGALPFFTQAALVGVIGIAVMAWIAPLVTAVIVVATVGLVAAVLVLSRALHVTSTSLAGLLGSFTAYVEQQVRGIQVVKGHGFETGQLERGLDLAADVQRHAVKAGRQRAQMLTSLLAIPGLATLLVVGLGGRQALHGHLTAGELLALVQYLGLLVLPIVVGAQVLTMWPTARASLVRIADVLAVEPAVTGGTSTGNGAGVALRDVTYGVLRDLDLEVPAGTSLALVGPSGCGKSTVLELVERLHDPVSGTVEVGGLDVRQWDLVSLRSALTFVFQEAQLFSSSIEDNVRAGGTGDVRPALDAAEATPFVDTLPEGVATVVGERGSSLSGGQRQRVALARGLVRETPVLLLDDVISALDPTTARLVRGALASLLPTRTALIVAQDHEVAALADQVVLLDAGRVVARGTHAELLRLDRYREALGLLEEAS